MKPGNSQSQPVAWVEQRDFKSTVGWVEQREAQQFTAIPYPLGIAFAQPSLQNPA